MKKITVLFAILFACASAFATDGTSRFVRSSEKQAHTKNVAFKKAQSNTLSTTKTFPTTNGSMNRTSQAPFFSEVFAGGLPPTWQNIDSSGSGVLWTWTTVGAYYANTGFDSLSVQGTSATNGYIKFDSDSSVGASGLGEYGVLITDPIDCSGHSSVKLTFNEFFLKYQAASPILINTASVYVSTDGTSWTMVHSADAGLANYESTPNPNAVGINISSIAANQATVYIKFSFSGDFSYYWFVDDLELSEVGALDAGMLGIIDPFNGCALSSAETIVVGLFNDGLDSLSSIPVYYSVNGGTPVFETITDTIAPGDNYIYPFTTTADLSAAGPYSIVAYVAYPGDVTSANDTVNISTTSLAPSTVVYNMGFEVGEDFSGYSSADVDGDGDSFGLIDTLARTGMNCIYYPFPTGISSDNWAITSCFDFLASSAYNVSCWATPFDATAPAVPYNLEIYVGDSPDYSTMTLVVAAPAFSSSNYVNVNSNFTVPADGLYYIGFRAFGTNVDNALFIDDITVDFATGINNPALNNAISVYPNPSQGKVYVANKGAAGEAATIKVMNTVGQVVAVVNTNNFINETIDLSKQPDGLYSVQISTASGVVTKTVMVSAK